MYCSGAPGATRRLRVVVTAVLLLAVLVAGGVGQAAEYPLDLLSYNESPDGFVGGEVVHNVIGVDDNPYDRLRIGVFEGVAGGVGPSLRASAWMSAIVAGNLAEVDLFDYTIYFDFPGVVDGPSAGAMKTVALLAIWLGHEMSPDVVMTGTVNPDATIGPVGGIKEKIEAAASIGKELVLIPIGQRFEYDDENEFIDHIEYGESLGIEVRTVGSIYEAYPLITGEPLPRLADRLDKTDEDIMAVADARDSVTLLEASSDDVMIAFSRWNRYLEEILEELAELGGDVDEIVEELFHAWELFSAGQFAAAYDQIIEATMLADIMTQAHIVEYLLAEDGLLEVMEYVHFNADVMDLIGSVAEVLVGSHPSHMGELPAVMQSGAHLASSIGIWIAGHDKLDEVYRGYDLLDDDDFARLIEIGTGQPFPMDAFDEDYIEQLDEETIEAIMDDLFSSLTFFRLSEWVARMAVDEARWWMESDVPAPDWNAVHRLSDLYTAGVSAVNDYFDVIVLDEMAEAIDVRLEEMRGLFAEMMWEYAFADGARRVITSGEAQNPFADLGAAGATYNDLAALLVAFYSLGAEIDGEGTIGAFAKEESLEALLGLAEEEAVASIVGARRLGVEPVHSLVFLEQARYYMNRTPDDRIYALKLLWQADFLSKVMLRLAN